MNILAGLVLNWMILTQYLYIPPDFEVYVTEEDYLNSLLNHDSIHAVYIDKKIFVDEKVLNLDLLTFNSVLVHELVHHYQKSNDLMKTYDCIQESEKLAYDIQKKYLDYHTYVYHPVRDYFSPLSLLLKTSCYSSMQV